MIRNKAVEGGRQAKNEDFTQYIQSFSILERLLLDLNYGDFIVYGCVITGNNVSSGVLYLEGELTLFAGATDISFPLRLRKETIGGQPREFSDGVVRDTVNITRAVLDPLGTFFFSSTTPRNTDRYLRTVANALRGNIDANNNGRVNMYKPILADRFEDKRIIPAPAGPNRYLKIGTFVIGSTQNHGLNFFGGGTTRGNFAKISINRVNVAGTNVANGEVHFTTNSLPDDFRPRFFLRRNDTAGVYELWVRSAPIGTGNYSTSTISLYGEGFTDIVNNFIFENTFTWSASIPSSIVSLDRDTLATVQMIEDLDQRLDVLEDDVETILEDTGYTACINTSSLDNFTVVARQKNGIVNIVGAVKANGGAVLFTLPDSILPPPHETGNVGNVDTNGDVNRATNYRILAGSRICEAYLSDWNAIVYINITYFV